MLGAVLERHGAALLREVAGVEAPAVAGPAVAEADGALVVHDGLGRNAAAPFHRRALAQRQGPLQVHVISQDATRLLRRVAPTAFCERTDMVSPVERGIGGIGGTGRALTCTGNGAR